GVEEVGHRLTRGLQHGGAAPCRRMRAHGGRGGPAKGRRHGGRHGIGNQHPGRRIEVHPSVTQRWMQSAHPGDVVSHASHLKASAIPRNCDGSGCPIGVPPRRRLDEPGHPGSHTSPVGLWIGTLLALFLLITPGAIVARITQLTWPVALAVGPALTYGVVALAIIPFGALGIPWNGWTA